MKHIKLLISIVIILSINISVYAEDTADSEKVSFVNCSQTLSEYYNIQNMLFITSIDELLKTPQPSSTLINEAIRKYRVYEKEVIRKFESARPENANGATILENYKNYNACLKERDVALQFTKDYMMNYMKKNAAQKKSARLIEKYKQINSKLKAYNEDIAEFYSMLITFKNKLPGFIQTCIKANK